MLYDVITTTYAIVWETANAYFDYMFMGGFGATLFGPTGADRTKHNINSKEAIAA